MTEDLSTLLRSLRETAPKLNKTTDEANRAIRLVEDFLASLSLGIPAEVPVHVEDRTEIGDDGRVDYREHLTLSYAKHGNAFRLLLVQSNVFDTNDGKGISEQKVGATPLAEASRHDKLRAVALLPRLIRQIVDDANRVQADAAKAVGAVNEIVAALAAEKTGRANEPKRRNVSFVDPYGKTVTMEVTETEIRVPVMMDPVTATHLMQKAELEKPNPKKK